MDKLVTMKENFEFRRVYGKGKSIVSPLLVTYAFKRKNTDSLRFGFTSGKKIGCAVERNRSRRVLRAAASSLFNDMGKGWDIIFVARSATAAAKSYDVAKVMRKHLEALSVITK